MNGSEDAGSAGAAASYQAFDQVLNGGLTSLVAVSGCAGNLYSAFLMHRNRRLRGTIALHLGTLALWDAVLLASALGCYGVASAFGHVVVQSLPYQYTIILAYPLMGIAMTASVWMITFITSERHMAIWRPLSFRSLDTVTRAKVIVVLISFSALLLCVPRMMDLRLVWSNGTVYHEPTELRMDAAYVLYYRTLLYSALVAVLPFGAILFLTLRMILLVRAAQKEGMRLLEVRLRSSIRPHPQGAGERRRKSEAAVGRMLLSLALKFLACNSLFCVVNVWEAVAGPAALRSTLLFLYTSDVSNFLVLLNSATNCLSVIRFHRRMRGRPKDVASHVGSHAARSQVQLVVQDSQALIKLSTADSSRKGSTDLLDRVKVYS